MITEFFQVKVAPGKGGEAFDWASRIWTQSKKAGTRGQGSVLRSVSGDTDEVVFLVQYASMEDFDESMKKLRADDGWLRLVKEFGQSDWPRGNTRKLYATAD